MGGVLMALKPEIEAALIVVAGIWAMELRNISEKRRSATLAVWAKRQNNILKSLKKKYDSP
jgi:hypothetical protein